MTTRYGIIKIKSGLISIPATCSALVNASANPNNRAPQHTLIGFHLPSMTTTIAIYPRPMFISGTKKRQIAQCHECPAEARHKSAEQDGIIADTMYADSGGIRRPRSFSDRPYAKPKSGLIHQHIQDRNKHESQVNQPVLIKKGLSNDWNPGQKWDFVGSPGTVQDRELVSEDYPVEEAAQAMRKNG